MKCENLIAVTLALSHYTFPFSCNTNPSRNERTRPSARYGFDIYLGYIITHHLQYMDHQIASGIYDINPCTHDVN